MTSKSQSSSNVFVIDIPEVKSVSVKFNYNYYINNEGITETVVTKSPASLKDNTSIESFLTNIAPRLPRFNLIQFSQVMLFENTLDNSQKQIKRYAFGNQISGLITNNLDKVVEEDYFSSCGFTSVPFHDGDLSSKFKEIVSSTFIQKSYEDGFNGDVSDFKKSQYLNSRTPPEIDLKFISKSTSMTSQPTVAFLSNSTKDGTSKISQDGFFEDISGEGMNVQINNKVIHDIVDDMFTDPSIPNSTDISSLRNQSNQIQNNTILTAHQPKPSDVTVPYIDIQTSENVSKQQNSSVILVGYIIDKMEILQDGNVRFCNPIIVETPTIGNVIDIEVRYGAQYVYSVRTVAKVIVPAIDPSVNRLFYLTVLVSSRQSNKVYVDCTENCPPASPADFGFKWDFGYQRKNIKDGNGRLMLHWTFPTNSQRDIKKFQVFRRKSVYEPFVLLQQYDFNDNKSPLPIRELPLATSIMKLDSPRTYFYDSDFTKTSKYIYALASIDAHELTSTYSDQFLVWFDVYSNRLMTALISHSGAPKQYPNMYLEGDTFVDGITDSNHDFVRIFFNPEFSQYTDDQGNIKKAFETDRTGGIYKFQFVNLSTQSSDIFTLALSDVSNHAISILSPNSLGNKNNTSVVSNAKHK